MKTKKVGKYITIIQKGSKYFYHKINSYTGAENLEEITFDKNGNGIIGSSGFSCYTKEKLNILFAL